MENPREERKEDYLAEVRNTLTEFSRTLVRLAERAQGENAATQTAFERARREFAEKARALNELLAEVSALSPEAARARKAEVDAALQSAERAYTQALAVFD